MVLPVVILYSTTASSTLVFISGIPVIMQSASCEIVWYAFDILKLMSLCTLVYFVLLYSFFIVYPHWCCI